MYPIFPLIRISYSFQITTSEETNNQEPTTTDKIAKIFKELDLLRSEIASLKPTPDLKGSKTTLGRITLSKVEEIETNVSNLETRISELETLVSASSKSLNSLISELSLQFKKIEERAQKISDSS